MAPVKGKGVDDVDTMNAFLSMIGAAPVPKSHFDRPAPPAQSLPASSQDNTTTPTIKSQPTSGKTSTLPASPAQGLRAPPTTPATAPVVEETILNELDPIDERDLDPAEIFAKLADPNSSLQDSEYARPERCVYNRVPSLLNTVTMSTPARGQETGSLSILDRPPFIPGRTAIQQEIMDKIAARNGSSVTPGSAGYDRTPIKMGTRNFVNEDVILAQFKARAELNDKSMENVKVADKTGKKTTDEKTTGDETTGEKIIGEMVTGEEIISKTTKVFPSFEDGLVEFQLDSAPSTPDSQTNNPSAFITATADSMSPNAIEFVPSSQTALQISEQNTEVVTPVKTHDEQNTEVAKSPQYVLDNTEAELITTTGRMSISVKEPGSPEAVPTVVITASEDAAERKNATHFATWGTPKARSAPRARVRKVVLRGLPVGADLTLVQGLIHGGAIETFALGVNGTAAVTFTSANSCDAYFAKYPNGITFKYKGKSYVAFVETGSEVNVVSGMLQGQLDCGASRCVRAVGADHEWGMAALMKLAEGKNRKVEHICDALRGEIRTVVFRFASISDGVAFKRMLMRHEDWETANIQFGVDPCEKAAGVHLE